MKPRIVYALTGLLILSVACTDDDPAVDSTTTSPISTTTAQLEPIDLAEYEIPEGTVCHYLSEFVAVDADHLTAANQVLLDSGLASSITPISQVLNETSLESEPSPDAELAADVEGLLDDRLGILEVGEDPYLVTLALRSRRLIASPIHVSFFAGHIRFAPGSDPLRVTGVALPDVGTNLSGDVIGVVDTGIVPPGDEDSPMPSWMFAGGPFKGPVRYDPTLDVESLDPDLNPASHGTFVAGLMRQTAPEMTVSMAKARRIETAFVDFQGEELPAGVVVSSEIQVAEAIARLVLRHSQDAGLVNALNLSLGAYACDPTTDEDLVTMTAAIDLWLDPNHFETSEVVAAAGNDDYRQAAAAGVSVAPYTPFWPAALSTVFGVAAIRYNGDEVVWASISETEVEDPPGRPWTDYHAPGVELINLGGGITQDPVSNETVPELFCWSGSSFATALASARSAIGVSPNADYSSATGLTHLVRDSAGAFAVTVPSTNGLPIEGCNPQ